MKLLSIIGKRILYIGVACVWEDTLAVEEPFFPGLIDKEFLFGFPIFTMHSFHSHSIIECMSVYS